MADTNPYPYGLAVEKQSDVSLWTKAQVGILNKIAPAPSAGKQPYADGAGKLKRLLGDDILDRLAGKTVVDFGCGYGDQALAIAATAKRVIGVDIQRACLAVANQRAQDAGLTNVEFIEGTNSAYSVADVVISTDAFEHFADPLSVLQTMAWMLKPGGEVLTHFGPTWYHPKGGHLFSRFPWMHLMFSETALCHWRSQFRSDGAKCFKDVDGGLNQMTIREFKRIVGDSQFSLASMECIPIASARLFHCWLTREFLTSGVTARLVKRIAHMDRKRQG